MPVSDLLITGLQLMLLGMGIVFGFLILLVFVLKGMSRIADVVGEEEPAPAPRPATPPASDDSTLIAVMTAAVARYRAARGS